MLQYLWVEFTPWFLGSIRKSSLKYIPTELLQRAKTVNKNFVLFSRIISVELPEDARQVGIQFRWWQPYHSSQGEDVWAIDEIIMTSVLFNSISLDFTNLVEVTQSLGFYLGNVQPYCGHDWTLWWEICILSCSTFVFLVYSSCIGTAANAFFWQIFRLIMCHIVTLWTEIQSLISLQLAVSFSPHCPDLCLMGTLNVASFFH